MFGGAGGQALPHSASSAVQGVLSKRSAYLQMGTCLRRDRKNIVRFVIVLSILARLEFARFHISLNKIKNLE